MKLFPAVLSLLLVSPFTLAEPLVDTKALGSSAEDTSRWRVTFNLDAMSGGDELATVEFHDSGLKQTIHAGGGALIGAGIQYHASAQFDAEARLNYLTNSIDGETYDGDDFTVSFDAFPLDMMGYYHNGKHSIGAGLSYHLNPEYDVDGTVMEFDDALGALIEYRYFWKPRFGLTVKYQNIEYTWSGTDNKVDGSGLGVGVSFGLEL
ncbi:hypothetical protein ACQUQU_12275 [Thalassolituus sp. LLYu03]|uniref:hypothetical protein n=1 Tax=Thalassolituus sp. LLYu03 TaxID=3421656 RepID=UPI003D278D7F